MWRRSGLLNGLGFNQVVTPSGMVCAYDVRVGFTRQDTSFMLAL